jgi:hypothetical protein
MIFLFPSPYLHLAEPSAASDLCDNPRRTESYQHAKVEENEHAVTA